MAGKKGSGRKRTLPDPKPRACEWCGIVFTPVRKKWRQRFCGLGCQRASIGLEFRVRATANGREHIMGPITRAEFQQWRAQKNAEIARAFAWKTGNTQRGSGAGKTYGKLMGRHEHRVIAEMMLERELLPGEVVHHVNGNKRDNRPENLRVLSSQSAHVRLQNKQKKDE